MGLGQSTLDLAQARQHAPTECSSTFGRRTNPFEAVRCDRIKRVQKLSSTTWSASAIKQLAVRGLAHHGQTKLERATVHYEQSPLPPDVDEVAWKRFWSVAIHIGESTLGQGRDLQEVGKRAHLASVSWSDGSPGSDSKTGQHDGGKGKMQG